MLIHHFWPGPFSTVAFFTGQSWCFVAVCISDKKPCGVLFMGFLLLESTLSCIYLLIFSSWECSSFVLCVCVCVCLSVFIYLFNFGCVTTDMFKGRCPVESRGLVNIRCPSAIVFMLQLQRKSSMLKGLFILSYFRMACAAWGFYSGLVVYLSRMSQRMPANLVTAHTWCLLTLGFYFK